MALRILFSPRLYLFLVVAIALAHPVQRAAAATSFPASRDLPVLKDFAHAVSNGRPEQLRGAYATGIFADRVVQQPSNDPTFVSPRQHILTQFSAAAASGSTGLLAHNHLSGANFARLEVGQSVILVYGDGSLNLYAVTAVYRFQARQPENPQSDFVDLVDGTSWSAAATFQRLYSRPGALVLQTCIAADGNRSWGRLFVVAEPVDG